MNRAIARAAELERKLETAENELLHIDDGLRKCTEDCNSFDVEKLQRERKVCLRGISDTKIRLRNLKRSFKIDYHTQFCPCPVVVEPTVVAQSALKVYEIDAHDDKFDPLAVQMKRVRPQWRTYPSIPLPHSEFKWRKFFGVYNGGSENSQSSNSENTAGNVQFADVEQDVVFTQVKETVADYSVPTSEEYGSLVSTTSEDVSGILCSDQKPPRKIDSSNNEIYPPDLLRPHLDDISREALLSLPNKDEVRCICDRSSTQISCFNSVCYHSFTGRLVLLCPLHPTRKFLMDHPRTCPRCKSESLAETFCGGEQRFTQIKQNIRVSENVVSPSSIKYDQVSSIAGCVASQSGAEGECERVKPLSVVPRLKKNVVRALSELTARDCKKF